MGLSSFVDVVIGLLFMYLLLSLMCTTVVELISTALKWRSETLKISIQKLIDDQELRDAFYAHGLIVEDKVASSGGSSASERHPSYIDGKTFAMALLSVASDKKAPEIQTLRSTIEKMTDSKIKQVILANIDSGHESITALVKELGDWFDSAMDRLSGVYKRKVKILTLVIALAVAVLFNADTLSVGSSLWNDETLRGNVVNSATQFVQQSNPKAPTAPPARDATSPTSNGGTNAQGERKCSSGSPEPDFGCLVQRLKSEQEQLRPFPIGWSKAVFNEFLKDPITIPMKVIGVLLTALALTLGAPFWFDLLDKFMKIRGTGPKPERTKA